MRMEKDMKVALAHADDTSVTHTCRNALLNNFANNVHSQFTIPSHTFINYAAREAESFPSLNHRVERFTRQVGKASTGGLVALTLNDDAEDE